MLRKLLISTAVLAAATTPAFAHLDPIEHGSFAAGFTHPLSGADHMLAMIAVGFWAAILGGRAIWIVPGAFVGTMILGFLLAMAGAPLPFVEPAILASVVFLGLVVAIARPVPVWFSAAIVGSFALFHGFAHGGEMGAAGALDYAGGFATATAVLHVGGIGLGLVLGRVSQGRLIARAIGALTALAGVWLLVAG